jgi:hypothetical protein
MQANAASVIQLADAQFNEYVSIGSYPEGQAYGGDLYTPESVFADYSDSSTLADGSTLTWSGQGQALTTGGNVPAADVVGSSQLEITGETGRYGIPVEVGASVSYAVSIQPKEGVTLPAGQFYFDVPITILAAGSVFWQGTALDAEWLNGIATSIVNVGGDSARAVTGYGGKCANVITCQQNSASAQFEQLFQKTLTWNAANSFAGSVPVSLTANVDFRPSTASSFNIGDYIESNSISAQAVADPVLGFVNPEDAELFEFIVSPGISVSAVPVPGAVWLFGSGLIGLLGLARPKH